MTALHDLSTQVLERALCVEVDPELFFPTEGQNIRQARQVCAACPVKAQCLELALALGVDGVWGGTSPNERRALGAKAHASVSEWHLQPCGTAAARERHRTRHETCDRCGVGNRSAA